MDQHVRNVYLAEAAKQCRFALNAIKGLNNVLTRLPEAARAGDFERKAILHEEVFRSIHSFLTHLSNVSRLLWPGLPARRKGEPEDTYKAKCRAIRLRGHELRVTLALPEREHKLRSRLLRNHLEHFDERLDDWHRRSAHRNIVQDFIGPPGGIVGIDDEDMMRWFDPTTNIFRFRGREYNLQELVSGVDDLLGKISMVLDRRRTSG